MFDLAPNVNLSAEPFPEPSAMARILIEDRS
jgi:hypothetical protein